MARRTSVVTIAFLVLTGCDGTPFAPTAGPDPASTPGTGPSTPGAARLVVELDRTRLDVVGVQRSISVTVYDASNRQVEPAGLTVTSSDWSVAVPSGLWSNSHYVCDTSVGTCTKQWVTSASLRTVGPGTAVIRASVGGVSQSLSLRVSPYPTVASDLVVDSFKVVEQALTCWDCSYMVYAPFVWLRQPAGSREERLEAVGVTLPGRNTDWCWSSGAPLVPGTVRQINRTFDPYLWNNEFIVVALDGAVPDGQATVRVIVSDESGALRIAESTGPIIREGTIPWSEFTVDNGCW